MHAVTIILLTYNEERNLPACLTSIKGTGLPIFAVDSFSTDNTLSILKEHGVETVQHAFENYSKQRNWAQQNNPFKTEWVFHLDAGERFTPELAQWLKLSFNPTSDFNGYMFSRRTLFFGKWIKHGGHYPNFHLRLFKVNQGRCEDKLYDQHFVCTGKVKTIRKGIDIIDTVADDLQSFTRGHARWAVYEALEIIQRQSALGEVKMRFWGNPMERQRWLKNKVFQRTPLLIRAIVYFLYRYIIRLGFMDGRMGLVFHMLQGFWFRFLIDSMVVEIKTKMQLEHKSLEEIVSRDYGSETLKLLYFKP